MRPAFDERRRREEDRLAHLRLDLAQVLVLQEVPGIHLVDRDAPQRAVVEVAQVFVLPLRRPLRDRRRSGSSRRGLACVSNGPGVHMLALDQRKKSGVGATTTRSLSGSVRSFCFSRNDCSSPSCCSAALTSSPGAGCCALGLGPRLRRIAAIQLRRGAPELPPAVVASSRSAIASSRSAAEARGLLPASASARTGRGPAGTWRAPSAPARSRDRPT